MKINFLLAGLLAMVHSFAQPTQSLEENEPVMINGIECSFRINKESTKKAGDNEYGRYVLDFYAINKGECSKYIPYQYDPSDINSSIESLVATFNVRNANGKRFTSTAAKVNAKPWWVRVRATERDSNGKEVVRLRDMQAGYIFRRGDQLKAQIIVLVPKEEKPKVEVALQYFAD